MHTRCGSTATAFYCPVVVAHVEPPAAPVTPHIPEVVESVLAAMSLSPGAIGATGFGFGAVAAPFRISSTRGP